MSYFSVYFQEDIENNDTGESADYFVILETESGELDEHGDLINPNWYNAIDINYNDLPESIEWLRGELRGLQDEGHTIDWNSRRLSVKEARSNR